MDNVLIILGMDISLYKCKNLGNEFIFNNKTFFQFSDNDFSGFYDWLRKNNDEIIGIRFWCFDYISTLIIFLEKFNYVNIIKEKAIEIFFNENMVYEKEISNDQDFVSSVIYLSEDKNEIAFSFDISFLNQKEANSLRLTNL